MQPSLAIGYYPMNTQRAPFDDRTVRKAVNQPVYGAMSLAAACIK